MQPGRRDHSGRRWHIDPDSVAERRFSLLHVIDAEHITATVRDGILRLTLPKRAAANPRRIPVT